MIVLFRFFPTEYVLTADGSKGQIESCRVDVDGTKRCLIRGVWWRESDLEKAGNRNKGTEE
jgi:hypothetical protein